MTIHILKVTSTDDSGALTATSTNQCYISAYKVTGSRKFDGIVIKIFHDKNYDIDIHVDPEIVKSFYIDLTELKSIVLDSIESGDNDIYSLKSDLSDGDCIIYDDAIQIKDQSFRASPKLSLYNVPLSVQLVNFK